MRSYYLNKLVYLFHSGEFTPGDFYFDVTEALFVSLLPVSDDITTVYFLLKQRCQKTFQCFYSVFFSLLSSLYLFINLLLISILLISYWSVFCCLINTFNSLFFFCSLMFIHLKGQSSAAVRLLGVEHLNHPNFHIIWFSSFLPLMWCINNVSK